MNTLYDTLGLTKDASQQDIKKQYHKLAKQFHPDKSPETQQKFKQISNAYQILSDKHKKQQYDMSLNFSGFSGLGGFGGFGLNSMFGDIFNHHQQQQEVSDDIHTDVIINLSDVIKQNVIQKQIQVKEKCTPCNGTGAKDGELHICSKCNGSGTIILSSTMGPAVFKQVTTCDSCNGIGKVIHDSCPQCSGGGFKMVKENIQINIPMGIEQVTISMRGRGHRNKQIPGNLFVKVNINNNTIFTRRGNNLIYKHRINYYDLILGSTCELQDLYGNNISIQIPTGTKQSIINKDMGIYSILIDNNKTRGDLILQIDCHIPSTNDITDKQRKLLQEIRGEVVEDK